MPSQYQIEQASGITDAAIAQYLMSASTPAAINALNLLRMQCSCFEEGGFALLKAAVADCRKEMATAS